MQDCGSGTSTPKLGTYNTLVFIGRVSWIHHSKGLLCSLHEFYLVQINVSPTSPVLHEPSPRHSSPLKGGVGVGSTLVELPSLGLE